MLVVEADGAEILRQAFVPSANDPEARTIRYNEEYKIFQNVYDKDYTGTVSQDASKLAVRIDGTNTDWLTFGSICIQSGDTKAVMLPVLEGGVPPATYRLENGVVTLAAWPPGTERFYDLDHYLDDWKAIKSRGVRVMVGEFNQSNKTPHADALRYYEFLLKTFRDAGFDWASWDLDFPNGGGPFNSGRDDANYEDYRGYKLDREMLKLLQKY
jgi:hypothetical protein